MSRNSLSEKSLPFFPCRVLRSSLSFGGTPDYALEGGKRVPAEAVMQGGAFAFRPPGRDTSETLACDCLEEWGLRRVCRAHPTAAAILIG
jgi:hypothetical protein